MKSESIKVFMEVTPDKYELPVAVANSAAELARITGKKESTIKRRISEKHKRYVRVDVPAEDE